MITKGYQDVPMTRRRAQLLEEYAGKLADMLEAAPNDKDLAEWVQSKIDRAAAAIQSAYHYLDQDDLEKAVGHKYTHRKLIGRDPKTNRARYRYYYAEHQGGGISRAKFEAGSAFKLTWKGRRGHFHIQRVEGDKVFITHDSRPDMEPVAVQADELRALLKKQHSKAEQKHVEKRRKKVEEIKRRAHRGGLGLALHRLRQAAAQAGVSLPEQYQRKPKKTRAPVAETAREVETPKAPAPKTRADLAKLIHQELLRAGFKGANLWIRNEGTDREKARVYLSGKGRKQGVIEALSSQEYGSEGAFRLQVIQEEGLEGASDEEIQAAIDRRSSALDLKLTPPKLDPEQLQRYLEAISAVARKLKDNAPKILDPSDRPALALTLDYTETPLAQRSREELETLRTKAQQANSRESRPQDKTENTHAVSVAQHIMREVGIALGETTAQTTQTTPRDQLKDTAQQIIEEANQEHEERHDEHQEITRFELGEHVHTKTGAKLFTAKQTERVDRDEYFRRVEIAKKYRGRYERRYVRGFVFRNAEDARAFALEVEGAAQPEESAETVTPHEDHPSADNFETMPEVESAEDRTRGDLKSKQQALDLLRRSEQEDELKGRWRAKGAGTADKALMRAVREILKRPDPTQDLDERGRQRLRDSLFSLEEAQRPNKYMNAQRSKEKRQSARATIKEILDQQVRMVSEALNPTPTPQTPAPEPTTPSTRPANVYGRATKKLVDQALSTEPTDFDPNRSGIDLPTKGDLREMLSQEQRLERAKEDLRSTGAPNFLGQKNPIQDIMDALDRYLNGPYVELEQKRLREMERGLKIALRDSKGEELEQVKDETARFWREWGGEYKRLQDEFAKGRTQGEALRNIRAFIPKRALTPEINQQLDQMEQELDQRPITGHDIARWIDTRDTNKATRDRQPTAPARQALTETAEKIISEPPPAPAVQADFDTDAIQEAIDNGHELTPVIALQRQFIERRNAGLLTPALLKESLRIYETMIEKGVEAKIKKKKKGVLLNYIASNISAMTAYRLKSEKKQEAVEEMMSSFIRNVTNTPLMKERRNNVTYNIFDLQDRETDIERIKRLVSEYTEEDAIEDNRRLEAEIAQAEQQRAEKERVQANPQTAQDYIELKRLKRNKGEELSAEQHAKHNDLVSRSRREKRETDKPRQAERQKAKRDALRERLEGYRDNANEALNADRRTNTARRARFARYATEDAFRRIEYVNKSQRVLDAIDEERAYHLKNISNATDLDMLQSIIDRAKSDEASAQGQQWSDYEKARDKLKAAPIPQNALESRDLYPDKLQLFSADIKSLKKYLTRKDGTARRGARTALAELNAMLSEPKEKRHTVSMDTLTRVLSHVPPETDKSYGVLSRVVELKRDHDRIKRLGIENELELKAALREYEDIVYQLSPEDERAHKEAEQAKAERDRLIRRGELARMNIPSYFPTPASVIDRMIEIAGIEEGETVLEPSAGAGHILEKLADTKASVKAIEANITLRDYLQDQGHEVVGNDSLEHSDTYDHVIMNPPFEKQADIDHVTHAFENNLVEGGRLVAVMSASAMTRDNKKARDFQELVNKYGQYEKLPQGTFKDSDRQTGVNTILVTLDLPTKGLRKGMRQPTRATKNSHRAQLIQTVERLAA